MSILLDAVNRKKQQQGDVADLLSMPSIQPSLPSRQKSKLTKYTVLAGAIIVGIGAAWGMSVLLQPSTSSLLGHTKTDTDSEPVVASPVVISPVAMNPAAETQQPARQDNATNDDIRLAGKVALPIAKPFNHYANASVAANNAYVEPAADPYLYSSNGNMPTQSTESTSADTENALYEPQYTPSQQQEPIILGANANQRGLAELEALRLQVQTAAQDVDFASVKAPSVDERNNLMAAFETALKEVEFEQSANQQVTEAKLDPIPRPNNQQIPSYGDLPASVQLQVPEFNVVAHVYATEPSNRWLNVDGIELQQGDMIKNKLTIIEIRPRDIVLDIQGQQFRVPAI